MSGHENNVCTCGAKMRCIDTDRARAGITVRLYECKRCGLYREERGVVSREWRNRKPAEAGCC